MESRALFKALLTEFRALLHVNVYMNICFAHQDTSGFQCSLQARRHCIIGLFSHNLGLFEQIIKLFYTPRGLSLHSETKAFRLFASQRKKSLEAFVHTKRPVASSSPSRRQRKMGFVCWSLGLILGLFWQDPGLFCMCILGAFVGVDFFIVCAPTRVRCKIGLFW